jgi:hypothetical protein
MNFSFDGAYMMPGQTSERFTWENTFWFGDRHLQQWTSGVISGAARDVGNTSYTTILRSGLLLGRVTATNKIKEWNPTGTDGSQYIFGVLDLSQSMQRLGNDQDRWLAYTMVGGTIKADRLIVPGTTALGISGTTYEHMIRAQMYRRFIFSDQWDGTDNVWKAIVAKTADYTVTEADNGIRFTNRGAAGTVVFTLPVTPKLGLQYSFHVVADQTVTVTGGTADNIVAYNNATADSIGFATSSTKIGGSFTVYGDGTGWLVEPHNWASAADASQITTVTDA